MSSTSTHDVCMFIRERHTAVLSTVGENTHPHGAVISYLADDNFQISFMTRSATQKARNMFSNARVALTIFDEGPFPRCAQIIGYAKQMRDPYESEHIIQNLCGLFWEEPQRIPLTYKMPEGELLVFRIHPEEIKWLEDDVHTYKLYQQSYRVKNGKVVEVS